MQGSILSDLISNITSNWVTILVSFLIGIGTYYTTTVSFKRHVSSANEEKYEQGREQILRILERKLVDGSDIKANQIDELLSAVDREYSINLSGSTSEISLLEDLELRIEDSRHLPREQKDDYVNEINNMIESIEAEQEVPDISSRHNEVFEELKDNINEGDKDLSDDLEDLEEYVANLEEQKTAVEEVQTTVSVFAMLIATLVMVVSFGVLTEGLSIQAIGSLFNFPVIIIVVLVTTVIFLDLIRHSRYHIGP